MEEHEPVQLQHMDDGRCALITLNRPAVLNAINTEMARHLAHVTEALSMNPKVRVIVITGAGTRAFSVGADLKERSSQGPAEWLRRHRVLEDTFEKVRRLKKPIIAAVNGLALGGGCELAMSSDFIIASETASFGQPEPRLGFMPGVGGTQLLPRRLPYGLAMRMLFSGESINAEAALAHGLVVQVCAQAELLASAQQIASAIALNSPLAIE